MSFCQTPPLVFVSNLMPRKKITQILTFIPLIKMYHVVERWFLFFFFFLTVLYRTSSFFSSFQFFIRRSAETNQL